MSVTREAVARALFDAMYKGRGVPDFAEYGDPVRSQWLAVADAALALVRGEQETTLPSGDDTPQTMQEWSAYWQQRAEAAEQIAWRAKAAWSALHEDYQTLEAQLEALQRAHAQPCYCCRDHGCLDGCRCAALASPPAP